MLHSETVETRTMDLINKLMRDDRFNSFSLVGGTALALKIGHRKSIDIDLFTTSDFNSQETSIYLTQNYNISRLQTIANGIFCFIDGIKVDLLAHKYPLLEEIEVNDEIRMVSLLDIGAMKLNAIYGNGTRLKDFIDIYALLQIFSLKQLLDASEKKYPENSISVVKQALLYHKDIDFNARIDYTGQPIEWAAIANRLKKAMHDQDMTFGLPELTKKLMEGKRSPKKVPKRRPKL